MILQLKVLLIILAVLITICTAMFVSVIVMKLREAAKEKKRLIDLKYIRPVLKRLYSAETIDFFKNHEHSLAKLKGELNGKDSLQTLEDLLLETLEYGEGETRVRARTIAYYFGFPEKCVLMIRGRLTRDIAIGCRKAGLYQYGDALPDILKVLDIYSSEVQFQALMALARIGDVDAMVQAFDKISRLVLVNTRTINEILDIFSGDRFELYKRMIHHHSDYLVQLFLRSIDTDIAARLIDDVIAVSENGGKESRLACIIAIGRSGNRKKIPILVKAMDDPEWEIRAMAAKTLGILTGPAAIKALAKAARDREWWVRQNAVTSILAYPEREKTLVAIAGTGDQYAYDSMQYALERADQTSLLSKIKEVWQEESKNDILVNNAAS